MKAVIIKKFNEVSYEDVPRPVPGFEEVLVKVKYSGICGTDIHVYSGRHPTAKAPVILGHEFVGELVEINTVKGTDLKVGEMVLVQPYTSCGVCDACIEGRDNVCTKLGILGVHENGSFAEFVKAPLRKVYRLPEGLDLKLATLVEPLAVAVHDVKQSGLQVGQTVFIIGGGPIGVLIAMVARLNGATRIAISEVNEYRIKFAKEMGFEVLNPKEADVAQEALKMTDGKGFDVVFEVSGTKPGTELMTKVAKITGTIIIVGVPGDKFPVDTGLMLARELVVKGVRIHAQKNFAAAIDIMKTGTINDQLIKFIDKEFKLEQIEEAIRYSIEDHAHFKVLLEI